MTLVDDPLGDDDPFAGCVECANCEGKFLPCDMDGDHCRDCVEELFGEEL